MSGSYTRLVTAWVRESEYRYVHRFGACIERRGYPDDSGWFLIPDPKAAKFHRFAPTIEGCNEAFVVFSERYES